MKLKASGIVIICIAMIASSTNYSQYLPKKNETLEEILVTNTNDTGPGSLRQAIYAANHFLHANPNIIRFNIPTTDPGYDSNRNIWVIKPSSSFEFIIDRNLIIDGFSQGAFIGSDLNPHGPEIVIDGSNAGTNTSAIVSSGEGTDIYGLTINRFDGSAILFLPPGKGTVSGCYLGTEYTGMYEAGNRFGISLLGKVVEVHIGPSEYVFPNVICGNTQAGMFLSESASNNTIVGNNIGLNRDGTAVVPNILQGIGLQNFCEHNEIVRNMIGGNQDGIFINNSNHNLVASNIIGTSESMEADYGNSGSGISIWNNSNNNSIINNIIGFNNVGVSIDGLNSLQNVVSRNNISHNQALGIDNKNGGNLELSPPFILDVTNNEIFGESVPNQMIEIFADAEDEGITLIDSAITDTEGNFYSYVEEMPQYPHITATARDEFGNTSEFSSPFLVSVEERNIIPYEYYLSQNYPNPFNPVTKIQYSIPAVTLSLSYWQTGMPNEQAGFSSEQRDIIEGHAERSLSIHAERSRSMQHVSLKVYDILGRKVATLVNAKQKPGNYEIEFDGTKLSSGIYFYKLISKSASGINQFVKIKKLAILK